MNGGPAVGAASSLSIDTIAMLAQQQQMLGLGEDDNAAPSGFEAATLAAGGATSLAQKAVKAAEAFEKRQASANGRAERLLAHLIIDKSSLSKADAFDVAIYQVASNRYVAPEAELTIVQTTARAGKKKAVKEWSLDDTFWIHRKNWCDSRDYYDTNSVKQLKIDGDLARALKGGLSDFISEYNDPTQAPVERAGGSTPMTEEEEEKARKAEEIRELRKVFWDNCSTFNALFDIYAALGGDSILDLSLNEFLEFLKDCRLVNEKSKTMNKAEMSKLFNSVDGSAAGSDNSDKALSRCEFLECLVRLAVMKYVLPGTMRDISDALSVLFAKDIWPTLDPGVFCSPDEFRRESCYSREICELLSAYLPSLKLIFNNSSSVSRVQGLSAAACKKLGLLMSLGQWKRLMRVLKIVGPDVTERDVMLCFVLARMSVVDGYSGRGQLKEQNLSFEGFVEAICRASMLKSLPTDEEVEKAGFSDAGSFLLHLQATAPSRYRTIIEERASDWGKAPPLPRARCVEGFVTLLIRSAEKAMDVAPSTERQPQLKAQDVKRLWGSQVW